MHIILTAAISKRQILQRLEKKNFVPQVSNFQTLVGRWVFSRTPVALSDKFVDLLQQIISKRQIQVLGRNKRGIWEMRSPTADASNCLYVRGNNLLSINWWKESGCQLCLLSISPEEERLLAAAAEQILGASGVRYLAFADTVMQSWPWSFA